MTPIELMKYIIAVFVGVGVGMLILSICAVVALAVVGVVRKDNVK